MLLTSRERLLKCIRHEPIDRVPISMYDLVGWKDYTWQNQEISYTKLMDYVRKYTDCTFMTYPDYTGKPSPEFETDDWTDGNNRFIRRIYPTKYGDLTMVTRSTEGIKTWWTIKHLFNDLSDIDKYLSLPFDPPEPDMVRFYKDMQKLGDKGLMAISVNDPICIAAELFEMSEFLTYAITDTDKILYFLDALHERQMAALKKLLKYNLKDVLFRVIGPEYATPPYLSPDFFYKFVTRYIIDICRVIKEAGGIPWIHSHGKVGKVLEHFAMTEAEILDPLEPPPDGDIELSEIKRLYGKRFCLFGNFELKELETASQERIDLLVKKSMDDAKAGGGFVVLPTATPINIPLSTKTEENFIQLIESSLKYGRY